MASDQSSGWGLCVSCKWWQIEPDAKVEHLTAGYCIEEKLQPFELRVTGNSGCNKYMAGKPAPARVRARSHPRRYRSGERSQLARSRGGI